jgi:hypothetical protein
LGLWWRSCQNKRLTSGIVCPILAADPWHMMWKESVVRFLPVFWIPPIGNVKGPHRPNANRQRDANFQFLKTNKTVIGEKFFKICRPNS